VARGLDVGVAEDVGDQHEVAAMVADQARGDGVPQRVRGVFDARAVHHGGADLLPAPKA
jgi:hypothetical protein